MEKTTWDKRSITLKRIWNTDYDKSFKDPRNTNFFKLCGFISDFIEESHSIDFIKDCKLLILWLFEGKNGLVWGISAIKKHWDQALKKFDKVEWKASWYYNSETCLLTPTKSCVNLTCKIIGFETTSEIRQKYERLLLAQLDIEIQLPGNPEIMN